jgi:aminomethyltransferase
MASSPDSPDSPALLRTGLHAWHLQQGGRMGGFAGFDMPIRYTPGTIAEHNHTRTSAGLFDVSHMGVAEIRSASNNYADVASAFERFVPCDVQSIAPGRQRYTQLLNDDGGIIDDLMIARPAHDPEMLSIVSNAGRKHVVFDHFQRAFPSDVTLTSRPEVALLALQGPAAEAVLCRLTSESGAASLRAMKFMDVGSVELCGTPVGITRSGYTGEDGFELAIEQSELVRIANELVAQPEVEPAGLGARDTLRLEAGLCLYGSDIDETTSPIEAGLLWSIQKRRRTELGFPGASRIATEIEKGPARKLVALAPQSKSLVRDHSPLQDQGGTPVGVVTSGGFGPTVGRPVAMGYISRAALDAGEPLLAEVRGNQIPVEITTMPFTPHTYRR